MNHPHTINVDLSHRVDASRAAEYLTHALRCRHWHVVCNREHQLVVHLEGGDADRFAVSFECTPPVDKAIYHGSLTSRLAIVPLHTEADLEPATVNELRAGLAAL
jgi:hypothetical protein